jgi:hypothetical protein
MSDRGHVPSSAAAGARSGGQKSAGAVMTGGIEHLDFGVRNTLLYYKDLKATLDLTPGSGANLDAVGRLLAGERVAVSVLFDGGPEALRNATKRVRSISYRTRRDVDKGSPGTLCLAWGLATWDNGRPATPAAPIILRQASVGRFAGTAEDFDLGLSGPWNLNSTLLRLLEVDFGVDVERGALADLVDELTTRGDPDALFERVTKMADDVPAFSIAPRVVLAPIPRVALVVDPDVTDDAGSNDAVARAAVADRVAERVADRAVTTAYPDHAVTTVAPDDLETTVTDEPTDDGSADQVQADDGPADDGSADDGLADDGLADDGPADGLADAGRAVDENDGTDETALSDLLEIFPGEVAVAVPAGAPAELRLLDDLGPDDVIAEIMVALRGDHWPEPLIEHADSGLRIRDGADLVRRWKDANDERPRPSRWDATHFALWGLVGAPPVGNPAIASVAHWNERRFHPVLLAWQMVAEHRYGDRRGGSPGRRLGLPSKKAGFPRGLDQALWGLPVDLLVEWAGWVFRLWPGAPIELLLPGGTPELVSAWYERARPVAELAVKTWIPFSDEDADLRKSAQRWVKELTSACDGGGAPLATWFERSRVVSTEAVAARVGTTTTGAMRGRRTKRGEPVAHAEHAI